MYIDFYLLFLATSPVTLFLLDLVKVKKNPSRTRDVCNGWCA